MRSPDRTRSNVDLPAPFGPTSAAISPAASDSETPSSSVLAPMLTVISAAASAGVMAQAERMFRRSGYRFVDKNMRHSITLSASRFRWNGTRSRAEQSALPQQEIEKER